MQLRILKEEKYCLITLVLHATEQEVMDKDLLYKVEHSLVYLTMQTESLL